jgi:DNA-binding MarR family transcriptional regulator
MISINLRVKYGGNMDTEKIDFRLANQLCFAIYDANRLFNKFYQIALAPFKLTYPQYIALLVLWENDELTLKELGERLSLGSNTLTPLLKRMEASGWITREHPESDRRQLIVRLTEKAITEKPAIIEAVISCVGMKEAQSENFDESLQMVKGLSSRLEKIIEGLEAESK